MVNNEWFLDIKDTSKIISKEETYILFNKYKQGDYNARNKLIESNIRLVLYRISTHFINVNYDKKDLVSIGIIGLINAVDTYDITKEIHFTTYAIKCIDNIIYKYLRTLKKENKVISIESNNIEIKKYIDIEQICINIITKEEEYKIIHNILNNLTEREKQIITLYFGFENKTHSQAEISKYLSLSQGYISKLLIKTLTKIKAELETNLNCSFKKDIVK